MVTVRQRCLEKACAAGVPLHCGVDSGSLSAFFSMSGLEERDRIKQESEKSEKSKKISGMVEKPLYSNLGHLLRLERD